MTSTRIMTNRVHLRENCEVQKKKGGGLLNLKLKSLLLVHTGTNQVTMPIGTARTTQ